MAQLPTAAQAETAIHALAQPARAALLARFFKTDPGEYGAGDQFLGLTMPEQRVVAKQFQRLPLAEVEKLVQSPWHDCRSIGLIIWTLQFAKASEAQRRAIYERYLANRAHINNWDLVDITAPHIAGAYLLPRDRAPLYELAAENHLWSQRLSIIATLAFIRKNQFQDTLALAELLLPHPHDLIHKAVGWMLREVGKRNEDALEGFLHDHRPSMPRTMLRYAIEKLPPARRQLLMQK
jgi:hypothetical protein